MVKKVTYIPGRIKSAAKNDPFVANAEDIEDVYSKEQVNNIISRTPETDVVVLNVGGSTVIGDIFPHNAADWEMGSLDGDTEVASDARCRTGYIDITDATLLEVTRLNTELTMNVAWYYYGADKHSIGFQTYISSGQITPIDDAKYIRFLAMPDPDGAFGMTPERAATAATCDMTIGIGLDSVPMEDRPNKLFRAPGPGNTTYSEWAWDGEQWIKLCEKDYGIDDKPIPGSVNMVKGGGIREDEVEVSSIISKPTNDTMLKNGRGNLLDEGIWENGTFNNEGDPSGNTSIRLRTSNFIPVVPADCPTVRYGDSGYEIAVYMYDADFDFINWTDYVSAGIIELDDDTAYIKFLIKSNPDGSDLDPAMVDDYGISVSIVGIDRFKEHLNNGFAYNPIFKPLFTVDDIVDGTIIDGGEETDTGIRKKTNSFIPIVPWHRLCFELTNNLWAYSISYYDSAYQWLGNDGYRTSSGVISPSYIEASYIKLVFEYLPNSAIVVPEGAMDVFGVSAYDFDSVNVLQEILQKHVDTVTQEGGRYDIFPQNFINGTINNEGEVALLSYRLVSDYVKVNPDTRYHFERWSDADPRLQISCNWYDKDKTFLGWQYYSSDALAETCNAEYVRICVRYSDDSDISPAQFIPFSMKAVDPSKESQGYFDPYPSDWEYGTLDNEGEPSGSVTSRIRTTSFHSIEGGRSYVVHYDDTSWIIDVYLYDEDFNFLSETLYIGEGSIIDLGRNVKYFKMLIRSEPDSADDINIEDAVTSGISLLPLSGEESDEGTEVVHLRFAEWNIGLLNYGLPVDGRWGIPDDQVAEKLPEVKRIITELDADVLFIDEYSTYVNRSYTMNSYDEIFKHFYPYYAIWGNSQLAVFSKYPLHLEGIRIQIELIDYDQYPYDLDGRPAYYGYINVRGHRIGLMSCHLSPYSSDRRQKEAAKISELMEVYDKCIVAGDMNSEHGVANFETDMAPFRTAGYDFGNGGYWGYMNTYKLEYEHPGEWYIDNTLTRGVSVNFFEVGSDRSVSDHFPTKSEISILTGE